MQTDESSPSSLPNPTGRRWVIPDIHGFARTFCTLVTERIGLQPQDQLFLLGDYIDRGPDSVGVIDYILHLRQEGYAVTTLRGNHEDHFLQLYTNYHAGIYRKAFSHALVTEKLLPLVDNDWQLKPPYASFFQNLLYVLELDTAILVHAGLKFAADGTIVDDLQTMLWMRGFHHNPTRKTVIHGHEVTDLNIIRRAVQERKSIIPLDNGCYYAPHLQRLFEGKNQPQAGNLCALNLDTFELVVQPNVG